MFNNQILLDYKNLVQRIGASAIVALLAGIIGVIAVFAGMHGNNTTMVGPSFLIVSVIASGYTLLYMIKLIQAALILNKSIHEKFDDLKGSYATFNRRDVTDK